MIHGLCRPAGLMLAALLGMLPRAALGARERLSLMVGHNQGLAGEPRLLYAVEDARRLHTVLAELGGVGEGRGYLLLNRGPEELERTLTEIEGRVKEIKRAGNTVELLVFYSGHGDAESLHLGGKAWPMDRLRRFLGRVEADLKITILDACNSGAFLTPKGGKLVEPVRFQEVDELKTRGSVVLTSSSALEFSHESKTLRGSLFSHYLLSGLRGAADYNRDRAVSLWEAYHYARLHTSRHLVHGSAAAQSPSFDFSVMGDEDLVLTSLSQGSSRIRFENCPPGTYILYNQALSEQWAEVDIRAGDTIEIQLPRIEFAIRRVEEGAVYSATADLRFQPEWPLRPASFRRQADADFRSKGQSAPRLPGGLEVRVRSLRQVPEQSARLNIPELGAHFYLGSHRVAAHLGWIRSETDEVQTLSRNGGSLGLAWGRERYVLPRITLAPEARYTAFLWKEERVGYNTPARAGDAPTASWQEIGYSLVHSVAGDLHARWRPVPHFHFDLGAGIEAFAYGTRNGGLDAKLEFPVSLGLGFDIW